MYLYKFINLPQYSFTIQRVVVEAPNNILAIFNVSI